MSQQPDLFESGEQRRDRGMASVISHEEPTWMDTALWILKAYCESNPELEFTSQEFRLSTYMIDDEPSNPNAWGAFWMTAVKRGIVESTGRTVKATMPQSHATRLAVYRGVR
jgi:hypothetical protein